MKRATLLLLSFSIASAATSGLAETSRPKLEDLDALLPQEGSPLVLIKFGATTPSPQVFEDGSWLLTPPAVEDISMMLIHYTYMPELFERYRKRNNAAFQTVVKAVGEVARASCAVDVSSIAQKVDAGWDTWEVALFVGGGVVLGLSIGIVVGYVANSGPVVIR